MATVAIMVGGAVLNAATFIGGNYLAKYLSGDSGQAALDEKKRHDLALGKYQRDYAQHQKDRTQLLDWVAEKTGKRTKPSTISKTQTLPWLCTTKLTEQRWQCHRSPSCLTTTSPARSGRMASCCLSALAPSPLDMQPFASCEHTSIQACHARWRPNSLRSTTAPKGTGKGWPPSNNWLPLPRSLKM